VKLASIALSAAVSSSAVSGSPKVMRQFAPSGQVRGVEGEVRQILAAWAAVELGGRLVERASAVGLLARTRA
jgi:hypothetical protein